MFTYSYNQCGHTWLYLLTICVGTGIAYKLFILNVHIKGNTAIGPPKTVALHHRNIGRSLLDPNRHRLQG